MIDWVSFNLPYTGPYIGTKYLKREMGAETFEQLSERPLMIEGSWSAKMSVQSIGGRLYVSGNPVKFLTGQNVAGTNDLQALVELAYNAVLRICGLPDCLVARRALKQGSVALTRVDCTFQYDVGSDDDVVSWLQAMEHACHVRFRGRGHFDMGMCSLMFGISIKEGQKPKASRRSTFKFYNKAREMAVHKPTCAKHVHEQLVKDVTGKVRGEACYRGIELKKLGYDRLRKWNNYTAQYLHHLWIEKMEIPETYTLKSEVEKSLPRNLQSTYFIWRSGVDCRGLMSRPTFYRHRKKLLEYGVDISASHIQQDNVVTLPVLDVLVATHSCEESHEDLFWELIAA